MTKGNGLIGNLFGGRYLTTPISLRLLLSGPVVPIVSTLLNILSMLHQGTCTCSRRPSNDCSGLAANQRPADCADCTAHQRTFGLAMVVPVWALMRRGFGNGTDQCEEESQEQSQDVLLAYGSYHFHTSFLHLQSINPVHRKARAIEGNGKALKARTLTGSIVPTRKVTPDVEKDRSAQICSRARDGRRGSRSASRRSASSATRRSKAPR